MASAFLPPRRGRPKGRPGRRTRPIGGCRLVSSVLRSCPCDDRASFRRPQPRRTGGKPPIFHRFSSLRRLLAIQRPPTARVGSFVACFKQVPGQPGRRLKSAPQNRFCRFFVFFSVSPPPIRFRGQPHRLVLRPRSIGRQGNPSHHFGETLTTLFVRSKTTTNRPGKGHFRVAA